MSNPTHDVTTGTLSEAVECNAAFKVLLGDGLQRLQSAGRAQRGIANAFIRRGIGMTLSELHAEVEDADRLLGELAAGRVEMSRARAPLTRYAGIVDQTMGWVQRMMTEHKDEIENSEQRKAVSEEDWARIRKAQSLGGALRRLLG
ncbi:MAG: hypothetical protein OEV43_05670 [Coriobacteriia bacterium]|nr:hypothetical protein [Coriobacteriia bacterium]